MSDGYLSKDKRRLAEHQRQRRGRMIRVDYMPGAAALAIIRAKQAQQRPGSLAATNSAVIDSIVVEWAALTGINKDEVEARMTSAKVAGINPPLRAGAYDFGTALPVWSEAWLAANKAKQSSRRVMCGARRHRDGQPCEAKSEPGKRRCRFHGGCSTGPRTEAGKARACANLRQYAARGREVR